MNTENNKNQEHSVVCDVCGKIVAKTSLFKHFTNEHVMEKYDAMGHQIHLSNAYSMIPSCVLSDVFRLTNTEPKGLIHKSCIHKFKSFYTKVTAIRQYKESDTTNFIENVLPWKEQHPKMGNSKELCEVIFPNEPEAQKKLYQTMLDVNPYYKHDGRLSPFSKDFVGYEGKSDDEKEKAISSATQYDRNDRCPNQIAYWINRGLTEEEAMAKVHERQQTFSVESCIEKYGEEKGVLVWKERQDKWQATLNSKSPEEIERINRAKMGNGKGYSVSSQKFFWKLYKEINRDFKDIRFATLDPETKQESVDNKEWFVCEESGKHYFLDFYVRDTNKVIEYDGDYWHNPNRQGNKTRDAKRQEDLERLGFKIMRVRECDVNEDEERELKRCLEFLREDIE